MRKKFKSVKLKEEILWGVYFVLYKGVGVCEIIYPGFLRGKWWSFEKY
jgi:hypothetical protein